MSEDTPPEDTGLPLGDIALDLIRRATEGDEPYTIHPQGPDVLRAAVNAVLQSGESREVMAQRFRGIITVCFVLALKENSPTAAETLSDALFSNDAVFAILGGREREVRQRGRAYQKFMDDSDMARAPTVEDRVPDDSLKLSTFMAPGQQDMTSMARQHAAKRGDGKPSGRPKAGPARTNRPLGRKVADPGDLEDKKAQRGKRLPRNARKA